MKIKPTMALDFKTAQPDDLPLVMEILAEAAAWLEETGCPKMIRQRLQRPFSDDVSDPHPPAS